MLPQFAATASSLSKMSALVSGVGTDAAIYDDPQDADIPTLLDSRYDADKTQGLKRLIAFMAQGRDVSNYFPQVVKGVASQSLEVKKLVYIYLAHYADKRADEALLSINSFQRDLSDINPMVRAWALRAMSGIRMRVVVPLVVMAINKCARDPSPYVRRCAANAISKVHSMDDEQHLHALVELISLLLNDKFAGVVGAASTAFTTVCPDNFAILRPCFRQVCNLLPEVDEWGQVPLMEILLGYTIAKYGYSRYYLQRIGQLEDSFDPPEAENEAWEVKLLLSTAAPLLSSQNSAVVLQAAKIYWFLSASERISKVVKPLLFLLRSSYDAQHVVLANVLSFSRSMSSLFEPYYEDFFIAASDSQVVRALKLDILASIATDDSVVAILQELEAYIRSPDSQMAADAVNAIGRCAIRLSSTASLSAKGLIMLITTNSRSSPSEGDLLQEETSKNSWLRSRGNVVVQAVLALRAILQRHPSDQEPILLYLLQNLHNIEEPAARAAVIWMLGEHRFNGPIICRTIPVLLRYLAKTFQSEADEAKLQILYCFSKVILSRKENYDISVLLSLDYVLNLANCDLNYDVRDRARMLCILLTGHLCTVYKQHPDMIPPEFRNSLSLGIGGHLKDYSSYCDDRSAILSTLGAHLLESPKGSPIMPSLTPENSSFLPGTISHVVGHMAPGYRPFIQASAAVFISDPTNHPTNDESGGALSVSSSSCGSSTEEERADGYTTENTDAEGRIISETVGRANLISLSDGETLKDEGLEDLAASVDLEAWLGQEGSSAAPEGYVPVASSSPQYEPRKKLILDYTNGDGLEVQYCFTRNTSANFGTAVPLRLFFHNRSSEPLKEISIKEGNSPPASGSAERPSFECGSTAVDLPTLGPDERAESDMHIKFQNLQPAILTVRFNGKSYQVRIFAEAGALLCPHRMSLDEFLSAESRFSGMHRHSRRKNIRAFRTDDLLLAISSKLLSAANVFYVAALSRKANHKIDPLGDSVLYFSGQTLAGSLLLTSVFVGVADSEGLVQIELKVSCDDALVGLALLNQFDKALTSAES